MQYLSITRRPARGRRKARERRKAAVAAGVMVWSLPWPFHAAAAGDGCGGGGDEHIQVVLDLNPNRPGCQAFLYVRPSTRRVEELAVYVFDPRGGRTVWGVGYLGGLDRGISIGHAPAERAVGRLTAMEGRAVSPLVPGNDGFVFAAMDPLFEGPEVQYIEYGRAPAPGAFPSSPDQPLLTIDLTLSGAALGDVFPVFVADRVSHWQQGVHGAFSRAQPMSLESGGDAVPDETDTLYGPDADVPVPAPPAAYSVDYVDGPGGAKIVVANLGDADFDGDIDLRDAAALTACFTGAGGGPLALPCGVFDFDDDGDLGLYDYGRFHEDFTGP